MGVPPHELAMRPSGTAQASGKGEEARCSRIDLAVYQQVALKPGRLVFEAMLHGIEGRIGKSSSGSTPSDVAPDTCTM